MCEFRAAILQPKRVHLSWAARILGNDIHCADKWSGRVVKGHNR